MEDWYLFVFNILSTRKIMWRLFQYPNVTPWTPWIHRECVHRMKATHFWAWRKFGDCFWSTKVQTNHGHHNSDAIIHSKILKLLIYFCTKTKLVKSKSQVVPGAQRRDSRLVSYIESWFVSEKWNVIFLVELVFESKIMERANSLVFRFGVISCCVMEYRVPCYLGLLLNSLQQL